MDGARVSSGRIQPLCGPLTLVSHDVEPDAG
jgi:hypothetical protein